MVGGSYTLTSPGQPRQTILYISLGDHLLVIVSVEGHGRAWWSWRISRAFVQLQNGSMREMSTGPGQVAFVHGRNPRNRFPPMTTAHGRGVGRYGGQHESSKLRANSARSEQEGGYSPESRRLEKQETGVLYPPRDCHRTRVAFTIDT